MPTMVKIGQRPRWKQVLCLECMAFTHKRNIALEGYQVLAGILTFPFWIWAVLIFYLWKSGGNPRDLLGQYRRWELAPYGGIAVGKKNRATRSRWHWIDRWLERRKKTLDKRPPKGTMAAGSESPLVRLPAEIRQQIFLYVVRPAPEMMICSLRGRDKREGRLAAVLPDVWLNSLCPGFKGPQQWKDASSTLRFKWPQQWKDLPSNLRGRHKDFSSHVDGSDVCRGLLALGRTCHSM